MENNLEDLKEINAVILNTLQSLVTGLTNTTHSPEQISNLDTLMRNNRWYLISNIRQLLSELYAEHGLVQTLIDIPVDDAFRGGIEIKSDQLSPEEIKDISDYIRRNNIMQTVGQAFKWTRLYGGGGLLIVTDQDQTTKLRPVAGNQRLIFRSVDLWELFYNKQNIDTAYGQDMIADNYDDNFKYNYYGHSIHNSRVLILKGKEPPSFIKPRLRGWGFSEVERLVRSLNQYLKNQDVIFELLDEAKIDVFGIKGFNSNLMVKGGTTKIQTQIQLANMVKNYQKAIVMDVEDKYEQKQMNFSGLGEMLQQIRLGVASDVRIPLTKLFGVSSAGFNSGEDDIENYNSMVEGEVRSKSESILVQVVELIAQKLFGITPEDITIEFKPLRVLSSEQEEKVKDSKLSRVLQAFSAGVTSASETKKAINKDNLLPIQIEETENIFDNPKIVTTQANKLEGGSL